jgi:hypothetical protein
MVHSRLLESLQCCLGRYPVSVNDNLGMNLLFNELFGFAEELGSKDSDRGGSVSNFVVLDFGNIDEDFGSGVVEGDGFEDGGSVIGDYDFSC